MTRQPVVASAPGKLVILGEYAVLEGAPAMALAVRRYCRARIGPAPGSRCHLLCVTDSEREVSFEPGAPSGIALVDEVLGRAPGLRGWRAALDSRELFSAGIKLGLGSSAAALTAWAGAWAAFSGQGHGVADPETLETLIGLHRAIQRGTGSGIDVAASLYGGVIRYQLAESSKPLVSTVRLPNGVGFAGVFTRAAASTTDYLARYHAWRTGARGAAAERIDALAEIARDGLEAASADDVDGFLRAVADYGECLERLGRQIGADIVTREHREVRARAERLGVAYKVSGAGGGDLGLAFAADTAALEALKSAVAPYGDVIELGIDEQGLSVETAIE